jgi:hypothetical protein
MVRADRAQVSWDPQKKKWLVRIQIGEEVLRRSPDKAPARDAGDEQLRSMAIETVRGDGYEIDPSAVTIAR